MNSKYKPPMDSEQRVSKPLFLLLTLALALARPSRSEAFTINCTPPGSWGGRDVYIYTETVFRVGTYVIKRTALLLLAGLRAPRGTQN
ncbi:hypothetical protein DFP73DRAFT_543936 [Morchella snyderi]|nr:hypothetical protein DFP73DRAFT_543936 [Morchella snyderi]